MVRRLGKLYAHWAGVWGCRVGWDAQGCIEEEELAFPLGTGWGEGGT